MRNFELFGYSGVEDVSVGGAAYFNNHIMRSLFLHVFILLSGIIEAQEMIID